MNENEYLKIIEDLNLENIELKKSPEYKKGDEIIKAKKLLRKLRFGQLLKKFLVRNKTKKYNAHAELENNYNYDVNNNNSKKPKIVVYSCISGKYDKLAEPIMKPDNIEYVLFSDNIYESKNWKILDIPENIKKVKNNILINRYIKFHPYELFKEKYDYAIYVDGNVKIISDLTEMIYGINNKTGLALHRHQFRDNIFDEIEACRLIGKGNYKNMKEQTEKYKLAGFPKEFGLYECCIIVSNLKNQNGEKILNEWWNEFVSSKSFRDQIALPYAVWKLGYKFNDIGSLGNNVYKNPKIRIEKHK